MAANHGDPGSGAALLWDVTSAAGERLLYATDTGWPAPDTLDAMSTPSRTTWCCSRRPSATATT